MKIDSLVTGVLFGVALGIHYSVGLATYQPLIVLFLVIGGLKLVLKK